MTMTKQQIATIRSRHERRLRYLQEELGYPADHPLVEWNRRQLRILEAREAFSDPSH